MFNKQVIDTLKSVNSITESLVLKYPNTYAVSAERNIMVKIPVSKLDTDEFSDIGFNHSLTDFLSLVGLFEDATISQENDVIYFKSQDTNASFITDDISLLEQYNVDETQIERTKQCDTVAKFTLTPSDMEKFRKASSVLKNLPDLAFESKDGKLTMFLTNTAIINSKSNTYSLVKTAETNKEFAVSLLMTDFVKLPSTEYDVEIKYNSNAKRNNYRMLLKSKTLEDFEIVTSINTVENVETVE